jgi:hypothetical protein
VDHLGLVQTVDGLGERIAVGRPTLLTERSMPTSARRTVEPENAEI